MSYELLPQLKESAQESTALSEIFNTAIDSLGFIRENVVCSIDELNKVFKSLKPVFESLEDDRAQIAQMRKGSNRVSASQGRANEREFAKDLDARGAQQPDSKERFRLKQPQAATPQVGEFVLMPTGSGQVGAAEIVGIQDGTFIMNFRNKDQPVMPLNILSPGDQKVKGKTVWMINK